MLIHILLVLVIAGVVIYLFNRLVEMDPKYKSAINCIFGLVVFLYIIQLFGLFHGNLGSLR